MAATFVKLLLSLNITNNYAYSISGLGDLLTSFNGTAITYDEIGNPLRYYNGSSYTFGWEGRRLVSALTSGKSMSFTYNEEGLRVTKTVNGETTHFIYDGSLLIAEYNDSAIIVYIYDAAGSPIGFKVKSLNTSSDVWNVFWYEKNLQGRRVKTTECCFCEVETVQSKELNERAGRTTHNDYATMVEM